MSTSPAESGAIPKGRARGRARGVLTSKLVAPKPGRDVTEKPKPEVVEVRT